MDLVAAIVGEWLILGGQGRWMVRCRARGVAGRSTEEVTGQESGEAGAAAEQHAWLHFRKRGGQQLATVGSCMCPRPSHSNSNVSGFESSIEM